MSSRISRPSKLSPALIAPLERAIDRQAALAIVCWTAIDEQLKQNGDAEGAIGLPIQFCVELAAILQLHAWEEAGLRGFLPADVPSCEEALTDLVHRTRTAPQDFTGAGGVQLAPLVIFAWVTRFAWAAPNFLQADVVLGQADEDALVDAMANLLWKHRHDSATKNLGKE